MANFHAKDYGTVQYNFHPYAPTVRGTIPDPSDDQLQTYHKDMRQLMKESGIDDLPSDIDMKLHPEKMDEYMEKIEAFDQIETHHQLLEIIARLCNDTPNVEQMMELPYRVRIRFVRYIQKELTSPEV